MNTAHQLGRVAIIGVLALSLAGCAGYQSRKTNNTLIGAGLGGAAGAVLSGGDPLTTVGGAAAGGLLGNIMTDDDRGHGDHRRHRRHRR